MKSKWHRVRNKNVRKDQYTRVYCVRFEILKAGSQRLLFLVTTCGVMRFGNGQQRPEGTCCIIFRVDTINKPS